MKNFVLIATATALLAGCSSSSPTINKGTEASGAPTGRPLAGQSWQPDGSNSKVFYGKTVSIAYRQTPPVSMQPVRNPEGGAWTAFAQAVLTTQATIQFDECELKPGSYTVFPVESTGKARLVVNSEPSLAAKIRRSQGYLSRYAPRGKGPQPVGSVSNVHS